MNEKKETQLMREIWQQPQVLQNIISRYIVDDKIVIHEFKDHLQELGKIERVLFLGLGSSYNACIYGNYIFEKFSSLPCEVEQADEFVVRDKVIEENTLVIALSQSGESKDIIRATRQAKTKEVYLLGITNNSRSTLALESDIVIDLGAGEEKAIAATKTFTSEILILLLIALSFHNNRPGILNEINNLHRLISVVLSERENIKFLARQYRDKKNLVILGRKYNYPTALEGAQKLKEITYIHAEGIAAEEFRHGPEAMVDNELLSVIISPYDSMFAKNVELIKKIKNEKGGVLLITTGEGKNLSENKIIIPQIREELMPIFIIIAIQILSLELALIKEIDIDNLRNIKKFIA